MNPSNRTIVASASSGRVMTRATRSGRQAALATAFGALPALSHAAERNGVHESAVLTAFGVLVAAAIIASVVAARRRRSGSSELAQRPAASYRRDAEERPSRDG